MALSFDDDTPFALGTPTVHALMGTPPASFDSTSELRGVVCMTCSFGIVRPVRAGHVEGWEAEVVGIFVDNAARFSRGAPLRNRVDTSAGFGVG